MGKKRRTPITVLEAVDHLSHLADLEASDQNVWLDPEKTEENQRAIRQIFQTLNSYLEHLYHKERKQLDEELTQKGLQAMMQLAGEAMGKLEHYTKLFKGAHTPEKVVPEYQQLQNFYLSKIFSKVKKAKPEEFWQQEGDLKGDRQALRNLEAIQDDRDYELFLISQTDGKPFFSPELLRHIGLVGNFDETLLEVGASQDDFFRRMDVIVDRDFHTRAKQIHQEGADLIERFFKEASHHKTHPGVVALRNAVMALLLGSNPKNLVHNTQGRSATDYFKDFETYLRQTLCSEDYPQWHEKNLLYLKLTHFFCSELFLGSGAHREVVEFIRHLVPPPIFQRPNMWETLVSIKEALSEELRRYPSGPLMKTLQLFRGEEEKEGFDPLLQNNPPTELYTLTSDGFHTTVMHLPCPIHQQTIEKVLIVPEFKGYLRSLNGQKHLYVNVQDRTSWKEHARSRAVESLSQENEFAQMFTAITLAKGTDFYHQQHSYVDMNQAMEFCRQTAEQLTSQETGFFFPPGLVPPDTIKILTQFVHQQMFDGRTTLNRKERLDFIEILYFFVTLKIVEQVKPDVINFSCKDGVDAGAAMAAEVYGFFRLLSTSRPWTEEDLNCLMFTLFSPALLVRHRLIASLVFQRTLSALEHFENVMKKNRDSIVKACVSLFPDLSLGKITIGKVA